jgi:hypothetical protein
VRAAHRGAFSITTTPVAALASTLDCGASSADAAQPWRFTMKSIQIGANGEVQPFETG